MALFGKKKAETPPAEPIAAPSMASDSPADASSVAAADNAFADDVAADAAVAAPVAPAASKNRRAKAPVAKKVGAKSGTVVGLNIGNAFIKAVEVTARGGQLSVTGMGVVATPPESYSNGNVLSVTALSNAIRSMWKQAGLSSKATVFSVAGTGSLVVRVIEVPKMTDGELADNMRVDADRYIPFPPSEVVMEAKALRDLPSDPDSPNMEVLLAAAQREIIDLHVSVVQKARLAPRAIDVEPLALARTLLLQSRAQNQPVDYDDVTAVLNIGQTGTEISIMRGDIVVFTRSVPNGGANLTNAIAESMGIPTSDAERLKIERGDALPPAGYADGTEDFGDFDFDDGTGAASGLGFDSNLDVGTAAGVAGATATTPTVNPGSTAPNSDDPFDLDFFDQGSQQSEPGAGHGQKEEDAADDAPGISFSFDELDDELTPSRAQTPPGATPNAKAPGDTAPGMDDLNLSDDYLPAATAPVTSAPAPAPAAPAMPSAFDFSDFDLPTRGETAPAPAAPTQKLSEPTDVADETPAMPATAPVVAPAAFGFGFSQDDAATDEAPTMVEETVIEPTTPVSLDKSETEAATTDDSDAFDLDDMFGDAPVAEAPVAVTPVAEAPVAETPVPASAEDENFDADLFGSDVAADDFGMGMAGGESDDFSAFGAGLSQTGETDDATLYAAMQPVLEDLAVEVRRSLEFHLGRYPDTTFSRLVLVGGGAKLRNLDEFLAGNLGVPTSVGDSFAHIAMKTPGLPPEFAPTNGPLCEVALGLALRDFIE